jgi:phage-related protein
MPIVGEALIVVKALTRNVNRDISRGFNGVGAEGRRAGESMGSAFSRGFQSNTNSNMFGKIASGIRTAIPAADQARTAINNLTRAGYLLGPAIGSAVGGISAVIGSLGALIGSAGAAISSMAALGSAIASVGIGVGVAKFALGGVGKAVSAATRPASGGGGGGGGGGSGAAEDTGPTPEEKAQAERAAAKAREQALRRIEDAEESLAETIESNYESLIDANNEVADAQNSLTKALEDGREEIQQLGFDAEDAALSEKKAAIELGKARETLARVQDLPPNSRARQEAELAYQEADLNLRKAKDRSADLNKEQERLSVTGVAGTQGVIDATKELADAEAGKAKTIRDSLRSQTKAEQALTDAKQDALDVDTAQAAQRAKAAATPAAASGGGGGGVDPFAGLNDAQKKFAQFLIDLKPKIDELRRIASEAFLPKLQTAIETVFSGAYDTVARGIAVVGSAMGDAAISIADAIVKGENLSSLETVFNSAGVQIIGLGKVIGNVWGIVLSVLAAASPLAEKFITFIEGKTGALDRFLNTKEASGELEAFFNRSGEIMAQFGDIFGNLFNGLGAIIKVNMQPGSGGEALLKFFQEGSAKLAILGDTAKEARLSEYFTNVVNNAKPLLSLLGDIVGGFLRLGENKAIGETFTILAGAGPSFQKIATAAIESGPALAGLVVSVAKFAAALSDSGASQIFLNTLTGIANALTAVFENPIVNAITTVVGRIGAFLLAMGLLNIGARIAFSYIGGIFASLFSTVGAVFTFLARPIAILSQAFAFLTYSANPVVAIIGRLGGVILSALGGPIGLVIGIITLLVGAFITLYNTSDTFRAQMDAIFASLAPVFAEVGAQIGDALKSVVLVLADTARTLISTLAPLLPVIAGAFAGIISALAPLIPIIVQLFGTIISAVLPLVATLITALIPAIAAVIGAVVPLIATLIGQLVPVFVQIIEAVLPLVTTLLDTLIPVFVTLIGAIIPVISTIIGALVPAISAILSAVVPLVTTILGILIPIFTALVSAILPVITTIIDLLVPVFTFLVGVIATVVQIVAALLIPIITFLIGVITGVINILPELGNIFSTVWQFIVDFVVAVLTNMINFINNGINLIFTGWKIVWGAIGSFFSDLWNYIVAFVNNALSNMARFIQNMITGIQNIWNNTWKGIGDFFARIWDLIVTGVQIYIATVKTVIVTVVNFISDFWNTMWSGIGAFFSSIWDGIVSAVKGFGGMFGDVFNGIADIVTGAFENVTGIIRKSINGIIGLANGAIRALNNISVTLPDFLPPPLGGSTFGIDLPTIPMLAKGGVVSPSRGGSLVNVAEAGKPERIEPLDENGMSKRDRAMFEKMQGGGAVVNITINGAPGQDEEVIANAVDRIISKRFRKGGASA